MALALVKYEEFFLLVSGYLYGARGACQVRYRTASVPMCIAVKELCHSKGGSYICLPIENIAALTC